MTEERVSEIATRLKASMFDNADLRRWFRDVDTFMLDHGALEQTHPDLYKQCFAVRVTTMRTMSEHLPQHTVLMDRLWPRSMSAPPFASADMNTDTVEHYRKHDGAPVVLIGLPAGCGLFEIADGRHRVAAARLKASDTIHAVFAWERPPGPENRHWDGCALGGA